LSSNRLKAEMSTKQTGKTRKSERSKAAETSKQQKQAESIVTEAEEIVSEQQQGEFEENIEQQEQQQEEASTVVTTVTKKVTSLLTGTPITAAAASSSSSSVGGSRHRRSRSPLAISREQEKEELAHLNTKLACYIEFVRSQQQSAETVRRQYESLSESANQEFSQSTGLYEREIGGLRQQLDRLAGERADLQLALDKANAERAQAEKRAAALEKSLKDQQRDLDRAAEAEAEASDLRAEAARLRDRVAALEAAAAAGAKEAAALRKAQIAAERAERENQRLQSELQDSLAQLRTFRDQLETEVKLKTELENRLQTAKEEAAFRDSLLKEERSRFQERSVVIEEVTRSQEAEFESRLCEELRRARLEADQSAAEFRLNLEATFKAKMDELRSSSDKYSQDARSSREELLELRRRLNDSELALEKALKEAELLRAGQSRLEEALRRERENFEQQLEFLREEERKNRERLAEQLEEYNILLTSKLALDQEILAYRQLLEEEQRRTNYSPHRHGAKRRRLGSGDEFDEEFERRYSASQEQRGPMQLAEIDSDGQFVRLRNTGETEVGLGGWTLRCSADDGARRFEYRFPAKTAAPAMAEITVWSSDSGKTAKPPLEFVSKSTGLGQANSYDGTLLDSRGQEVAWRKLRADFQRQILTGKRRLRAGESGDQRCSIM
ncbi:hypothetical protein BOX15_Mlig008394g1, partial [Macrostomum lignano]